MSSKAESPTNSNNKMFSLDTWAVFFALAAALLIRVGLLKHVPW
jgi:hypothetical protein